MNVKFTKKLLTFIFVFSLGFFINSSMVSAQNCDVPVGLNTSSISNFSATLNWDLDANVDHYRLRYKENGSSSWLYEHNATGVSYDVASLNQLSTYIWQAKAFCSSGSVPNSTWSVVDTFVTANYPVDCNNTPNGTAFIDSCGNCVGGTTGDVACIDFTPSVSIALSTIECNVLSDITFVTSQDANEPDISSSIFSSDAGFFNFTGLNSNDVIGSADFIAGGGYINVNTTLMVDFIITPDKISVKAVDNATSQIYGSFTIENASGGILVVATSSPDNNNVTSGNSQTIIFSNVFINPPAGTLTFTSTINSELGDLDVQNFPFATVCVDCNGDSGGGAFTDSCGNCVGGSTGNVACIPFSPTVSVSLSNMDCDSLTDLTINVSQDPNEPDMATSLFASDLGSFDISNMTSGDVIGSAVMSANGGANTFNTTLIVSSILSSSQAIIQSQDINTGLVLGTFTIINLNPGVSISASSVPDNNNVTSGNSQTIIFSNVFINPPAGTLTFTSTINSELGDLDVQNFPFATVCVDCNGDSGGGAFTDSCGNCVGGSTGNVACIPFSPTVSVSLSNMDCDSLTDLTINVSQDPNEPDMATSLFASDLGSFDISNMTSGDVIGSAVMSANGGANTFNTTLIVSSILSSSQAIIQSQDINTGLVLGTFTIINLNPGVSISASSVPDNNNVTSGNSQTIIFSNVFINPPAGTLTFTSTINSELGDLDVQNFPFATVCVDCNGDSGGGAFTDSCGNCVGGSTGNVACIPFSPTVSVSLSNMDCDSLTDLTINVSQDPNEPDMATSLFASDLGSFDISNMTSGDVIGSAVMSANGGANTFNTTLIVSSILSSSQAIIQSQDINTGLVLGTFTIINLNPGVSISASSVPDNNNVTSGNSQTIIFSNVFINPPAGTLTFTSTINSELGDLDVQNFPFATVCVDCNGDSGGGAFTDSCGNCVGGSTGNVACIPFSPTVSVSLSNMDCDSLTDLTINVSQDPNEPDMATSLFASDLGSFDISNMTSGDVIGSAVMSANGGANTFNTTLIVSSILSSSQAIIQSQDINTGLVLGTFTIINLNPGVSISASSVPDNNNVTSGNSQTIIFSNVFINPPAGTLTFTSTINSELGDLDVQNFPFATVCVDCNGDSGGGAFTDSCGNCVGGSTGNVACIPFSPTVSVSLSNMDCDSLTDLTINVSQDPNEPDMATSLFASDLGSFDISNMTSGDVIGSAVMSANGGANTFNTTLIVSSILSSSQAIIQSQDINTGLVLGTFTIINLNPGVSISASSVPDNNNVTSGNSQTIIFSNVFINPPAGTLTFTSTINSELGDLDVQNFPFATVCVDCNGDSGGGAFTDSCGNCVGGSTGNVACIPFSPTVSVSLSNMDCDSLTDLTINVSQDPNEPDMATSLFASDLGSFDISNMTSGDVIGSAVMSANGGANTFNTTLIVSSILSSSQAIIQSQDINTGLVLGTFTIINLNPGVSISASSVPDNNNVTSGNSQTIIFSNVFINPPAGTLTFTSTINSELGDLDVQNFPFATVCVDCNGDSGGGAFTDSCGNCVGGSTGNVACIPFSPTVSVSLSNMDCDSLTDLTINVSQDPNEPDMATSLFASDLGSFDISNMTSGDVIGSAVMSANGGANTFNTTLIVSSILSSSQAIIQSQDINTGLVLGTFTIINLNPGVSISASSVPDNNNVTSGNSQTIIFSNVFINPPAGTLTFTSTINSELGDLDVQNFPFATVCVDCNGDSGGGAFTDSCGNCVGGSTGNVACIPFSPTVSVSLSNMDCDSLTDLTINVSQDPNEPDMATSLFASDLGSFDISNMTSGDVIGSAVMSANGGANTFNTTLIVSSILSSSQAIIQSQDINTGLVLGTFTIINLNPGVSISASSVPDNNNVTSGNSQTIIFSNVFINPPAGTLTFTSTINSELGDLDVQNFPFATVCVDCNGDSGGGAFTDSCGNCVGGSTGNVACIPFSPTVSVSLSNMDCDSLTDLTINVSQDPNEPDMATSLFASDLGSFDISNMTSGDVIGSAVMSANGGANTFNTTLIVSSILSSSQAIIQSQDINTGLVLGTFTIINLNPGVSISASSVPDNNNVTSGNSQTIIFSNVFINPPAGTLTFTSTINSELGDLDVQNFPFATVCVDCNGDSGGGAFTDSCGNCVGGSTGNVACIPFSPTVSVSLSNMDCDSLTDLTINVSQDPNEPDMATSLFASDLGSFDISNMTSGDVIGSAVMSANGGANTFNTTLIVSSILSSSQAIIQSQDINTGLVLGTFTIINLNPGVSISASSVPDNNNVTSGNSQTIIFSNVFINPPAGTLTFTSTINSELGDLDVQNFPFTIACLCAPNSSTDVVVACDSYTWIEWSNLYIIK